MFGSWLASVSIGTTKVKLRETVYDRNLPDNLQLLSCAHCSQGDLGSRIIPIWTQVTLASFECFSTPQRLWTLRFAQVGLVGRTGSGKSSSLAEKCRFLLGFFGKDVCLYWYWFRYLLNIRYVEQKNK